MNGAVPGAEVVSLQSGVRNVAFLSVCARRSARVSQWNLPGLRPVGRVSEVLNDATTMRGGVTVNNK